MVAVEKFLARLLPLNITFWILKTLPRGITAKLIALVSFKTSYSVKILGLNFQILSGPQDDHFLDLEHDRLTSWESETLKIWSSLSKNAQVCLDVGAYLGVYSIISSLSGAAEVYAIEPNPKSFKELQSNVLLNGLENKVKCLNFAAGDDNFRGSLLAMRNRPLSSGAHLDLGSRESLVYESNFRRYESIIVDQVSVNPLDSIFDITDKRIDLIKIDVEGYELFVIEGAKNILRQYHPVLIIEIVTEAQKKKVDKKLELFAYQSGKLITDTRESRNFIYTY
jgi:FkbM family methyltransferase